jgi:hypothetical protein
LGTGRLWYVLVEEAAVLWSDDACPFLYQP